MSSLIISSSIFTLLVLPSPQQSRLNVVLDSSSLQNDSLQQSVQLGVILNSQDNISRKNLASSDFSGENTLTKMKYNSHVKL